MKIIVCVKQVPDTSGKVAVNPDGTLDRASMSQVELARQLVQQTGANYLHLLPSDDLIKAKLATVSSVPETIFVDSKGNLVGESYIGSRSGADWSQIIDTLLAQMGS